MSDAPRDADPVNLAWIGSDDGVLDIITSSSADGITIQDAMGGLIYANDSAARMSGFESGREMQQASSESIIARFELLAEDGSAFPVDELPGRRALRGEENPEATVRFRLRSGGEDRWALLRSTPLFDPGGQVSHVVNVFVDVTKDLARHQAQSFLADAAKELARSLDWEDTLQRVARLAVPRMADWCALDVRAADDSLSLVTIAHIDPAKVEWAYGLRERYPPQITDPTGVGNVVRTGVSELIAEVTQEMIDAADIAVPELREIVHRLHLSSLMYVPLVAHGRTIGALTMAWAESDRHYGEEDLRLAEDLASRAALAIENARLYRERDHVARTLQGRLLPKQLPDIPGLDTAARYVAAEGPTRVGGDFYDLFEMDDGSWKAVVGDVCGKGPEAAALMGFVRFTTRAVSRQDRSPSEALVKLNRALREELEEGSGEFCTAAVVRIHTHEGGARLTIAVGGHPLPIILRANGEVLEAGEPGTLLGVFEEIDVNDRSVDIEPGDAVVMLTDGVLEADTSDGWEDQVMGLLADSAGMSAPEIADRLVSKVVSLGDRRSDDIAILVIRCRPAETGDRA
jgi:PAS domain S-box-containing protein